MDSQTILIMGACLSGFMCVLWALAMSLDLGLVERPAIKNWAFANYWMMFAQLAWLYWLSTPHQAGFANPWLLAGAAQLGAIGFARSGLQLFFKQKNTQGVDLALLTPVLLLAIITPVAMGVEAGTLVAFIALLMGTAFLFIRTAIQTHQPIKAEFSPRISRTVIALLVLLSALSLVAGAGLVPLAQADLTGTAPVSLHTLFHTLTLLMVMGNLSLNTALAAMVLARLMTDVRQASLRDHLTGLANRRQIEQAMQTEIARSKRNGNPYAVVMVDIDHFKVVNDTHGHAAGDEVLVSVANKLRATARQADTVGRIGGEEFCTVLPETSVEGALRAAERFRSAIEEMTVHLQEHQVNVTISVGVANSGQSEESWPNLLKRADLAMYEAKSSGRNCIRIALPVPSEPVGMSVSSEQAEKNNQASPASALPAPADGSA